MTIGVRVKSSFSKKNILTMIYLLVLDLFITMSSTLNPFSREFPTTDSSVFIYIGQALKRGQIPYLQIFDHKGPLLYAIEWLGLTIGAGHVVGIWILEVVAMYLTLFCLYRTARLMTDSRLAALAAVSFSLQILVDAFEKGNLSEEWALPLLAFSLYVFAKYIVSETFQYTQVFLTGMCFAGILVIRANMVATWVCWMPIILILLVIDRKTDLKKKISQIMFLVLSFILGIACVLLPIAIWYRARGAFEAMINTYLGYNATYMGGRQSSLSSIAAVIRTYSHTQVLTFLIISIYIIALVQWSYHNLRSRQIIAGWISLLYIGITVYFISVSGRTYTHYCMVLVPCLIIPLSLMLNRWRENFLHQENIAKVPSDRKKAYWIVLLLVLVLVIYQGYIKTQMIQIMNTGEANEQDEQLIAVMEQYADAGDSVYVFGNNVRLYLATQTVAVSRFVFPPDYIDVDDTVENSILQDKPKLIVRLNYYEDGSKVEKGDLEEFVDALVSEGQYSAVSDDYATVYVRQN